MGAIGKKTILASAGVAVIYMAGYTLAYAVKSKLDWKQVVLTNAVILVVTFVIGGMIGYIFDLDKDP